VGVTITDEMNLSRTYTQASDLSGHDDEAADSDAELVAQGSLSIT